MGIVCQYLLCRVNNIPDRECGTELEVYPGCSVPFNTSRILAPFLVAVWQMKMSTIFHSLLPRPVETLWFKMDTPLEDEEELAEEEKSHESWVCLSCILLSVPMCTNVCTDVIPV